jgi:hypothetical protein
MSDHGEKEKMINCLRLIGGLAVLTVLAACVEDDGGSGDNLSGTDAQFAAMREPCIRQAARLTGVTSGAITVSSQIQTGGGPLLVLNVAGNSYSCRLESDNSVTVFSEFAN